MRSIFSIYLQIAPRSEEQVHFPASIDIEYLRCVLYIVKLGTVQSTDDNLPSIKYYNDCLTSSGLEIVVPL
jgi:hypothetical protein